MVESEEFTKLEKLGEGGYGAVDLVNHSTWGKVACKKLRSLATSYGENKIVQEARIQQILRHPNIVILYDFQIEPSSCLLFLEYMKYGSVDEFLRKFAASWQWKTQVIYEVVLGMSYLHNQKPAIIHGDVTCGNILIGYEYHAKVSDFGLAHMKEISKSKTETSLKGTTRYIAPEYFSEPTKKKTESYDVYGFAICVWEIFSEKTAYYDCTNKRALHVFVENGERPRLEDIDEDVPGFVSLDILCECWNEYAKRRPTFSDLKRNLSGYILAMQLTTEPPSKREKPLEEYSSSIEQTVSLDQTVIQSYDPSDIRLMKKIDILYGDQNAIVAGENRVTGLTCLENKIYVAREHSGIIRTICAEKPFDHLEDEDIKLSKVFGDKDISDYGAIVYDMVACVACRSLFISRSYYSTDGVWKIQFPTKSISKIFESVPSTSRSMWESLNTKTVMRLSTNSSDELLVLVNQSGRWYLYIYRSSDGSQLQRIIIQDTNIQPKHAVKTPQRNIFISYIVTAANAMFVAEMSLKGEIVRKFDFDSMESFQMARMRPLSDCYLAFDGNNGLFVVDSSNYRMFLLDCKLMECQLFIEPYSPRNDRFGRHVLESPSRICCLFQKHYLIVGQCVEMRPPCAVSPSTSLSFFNLRRQSVDRQLTN